MTLALAKSISQLLGRQNWIRFGIRDRILRFLFNPEKQPAFEFEIDFYEKKYSGNLNNYLDWSVFFYGAYEKSYLEYLKALIQSRDSAVFVDVGANVGHHSLFMSTHSDVVYAFEPNPDVIEKLLDKININCINNIVVNTFGLGNSTGDFGYFKPQGCNKATGSFVDGYSTNNADEILLRIVNGDEYFIPSGIKSIDLIKIDVEGYEKNVLIGLSQTLHKYRPIVAMEYSEATRDSFHSESEILQLLPPNYVIKKISYDRPFFYIFNDPRVILIDFNFAAADGEVLMIPFDQKFTA